MFPIDYPIMPQVRARLSIAKNIDEITRSEKKVKSKKDWLQKNAEAAGIILDNDDDKSQNEEGSHHRKRKTLEKKLKTLQGNLIQLLCKPLQASFSGKYITASTMNNTSTIELAKNAQKDQERLKNVLNSKRKIQASDIQYRKGPEAIAKMSAKKKRTQ